ncbi:hypothetical protein C8256_22300 [Kluyvera genomosp. 2]|uniref:Uncharacterized protein n=1 Tax=Kluyvera genomosp. 2 TaxID=2774054 RepID=A0A2T2XWI4_9ENTR|nr:hypothetical protein C8256_22300 [Kluyvera genomosp. 2]
MANIAIGPSKRNFIIIIIPKFSLRILRLSLKVATTANTYCARLYYFLVRFRAYADGIPCL